MRKYISTKEDQMKDSIYKQQQALEQQVNEYYRLHQNPAQMLDEYIQLYLVQRIQVYEERLKNP